MNVSQKNAELQKVEGNDRGSLQESKRTQTTTNSGGSGAGGAKQQQGGGDAGRRESAVAHVEVC